MRWVKCGPVHRQRPQWAFVPHGDRQDQSLDWQRDVARGRLPDDSAPRGRRGGDGTIKLWLVDEQKLIAALCLRAGRNLKKNEWDRYIGSDTPWQPSCRGFPSNWQTPILKSTNMKNPLFSFFSNIVYETGLTSRFDGTRRNR
jgi:hypothetical protein